MQNQGQYLKVACSHALQESKFPVERCPLRVNWLEGYDRERYRLRMDRLHWLNNWLTKLSANLSNSLYLKMLTFHCNGGKTRPYTRPQSGRLRKLRVSWAVMRPPLWRRLGAVCGMGNAEITIFDPKVRVTYLVPTYLPTLYLPTLDLPTFLPS